MSLWPPGRGYRRLPLRLLEGRLCGGLDGGHPVAAILECPDRSCGVSGLQAQHDDAVGLAIGRAEKDAGYIHLAVTDHVRDIGQHPRLVRNLDLDPRPPAARPDELYEGAHHVRRGDDADELALGYHGQAAYLAGVDLTRRVLDGVERVYGDDVPGHHVAKAHPTRGVGLAVFPAPPDVAEVPVRNQPDETAFLYDGNVADVVLPAHSPRLGGACLRS